MSAPTGLTIFDFQVGVSEVVGRTINITLQSEGAQTGLGLDLGDMERILRTKRVQVRIRRRFRKSRTITLPVQIVGMDEETGDLILVAHP